MVWNRRYGADDRGYRRVDLVRNACRQSRKRISQKDKTNFRYIGETIMNSAKTDQPQHTFVRTAMKTVKIIVFFISFGMVYPHIFTDED